MTVFRPVKRIEISLWERHVGTLIPAPTPGYYAFKYDARFVASGWEIAPSGSWPGRSTDRIGHAGFGGRGEAGRQWRFGGDVRRRGLADDALGIGYAAKEEAFRRMAFNVLIGESDDHTKNFSFLMGKDGRWALAPAYDLTGSDFPSADPWSAHVGRHQLAVNGKFSSIGDSDLLSFADRFGVGTAGRVLEEVRAGVSK